MNFPNKVLHLIAGDNLSGFNELIEKDLLDLSKDDDSGRTLLHWAAQQGAIDIAERLIGLSRAIIDREDEFGQTALRVAVGEGHFLLTNLLLVHGAMLTASCDERDGSIRDLAKSYGHHEIEMLLAVAEKHPLLFRGEHEDGA